MRNVGLKTSENKIFLKIVEAVFKTDDMLNIKKKMFKVKKYKMQKVK